MTPSTNLRIFLLVSIAFFLLPYMFGARADPSVAAFSKVNCVEESHSKAQEANALSLGSIEGDQTTVASFQEDLTGTIQGGHQMAQLSSGFGSASFSRHIMSKDFSSYWDGKALRFKPIDPTTIFRPSDSKAIVLTTVSINNKTEFRWHYRSNSSKTWVSAYNWTCSFPAPGEYDYAAWFLIAEYWPGSHYPRAYKVEVYLDDSPFPSFSEFFEVTNGGLNSPRMCEDVDASGHPIRMKSRFTKGKDTEAHYYLRFDKIAYFNEELGYCHNLTTVWIQPNGSVYRTYYGNFTDYKDTNVTWNYWEYNYTLHDYISIDSSTPAGDWKVQVYLDRYLNNTWMRYGPIATTPFIVGSESVADWTFMVYLDADNNLETPGIEIFREMASVGSTSQVKIVVQMDRTARWWENGKWNDDTRFGNWTDCKRFNVTNGMDPTPGNAVKNLTEVNMGDSLTLKDFANWTMYNYPANYYFLVLWDHGTGFMGICYDLTDATDYLSLAEISQALSGLPAIIDVVFLDACSMSMTEVAYQIKDYANVLVGPEGLGYAMVGTRPAPYAHYLASIVSNPLMLPSSFAGKVVTSYIEWCNSEALIQNATMSATDLTKMTSLMAEIQDFALTLQDKETPYLSLLCASHEQIILARSLTEGYIGPYSGQYGYYIDLYHFAQLTNQSVADEELRNAADQVMTVLSIGNAIIIEGNKNLPDSHGLSMFFPDEKAKYDSYKNSYEEVAFVKDTPWDEFVKYHLSGYILTIKTPYSNIGAKIDGRSYTTDADGKIRVFVLPDSYTVNVTTPVLTAPGSRGVFTQWNDTNTSNPRTLSVNRTLTVEAEYETQHYVTIAQFGSAVAVTATIDMLGYELPISLWWVQGSTHNVSVPFTVSGASGTRYTFTHWNDTKTNLSRIIIVAGPAAYTANYGTQYEVTFGQSGVGTGFTGAIVTINGTEYNYVNLPFPFWWDNGTVLTFAFQSPLVVTPNAKRYVWYSTSGLSSLQGEVITVSTSGNITGNYRTQYYLTVSKNFGTVNPSNDWHDAGSSLQISASAPDVVDGERYVWLGWSGTGDGNYTGMNNPANVTMNGPIRETASWQHQHRLIMNTNFGTTNPSTGEHWYEANATIKISAAAPTVALGEQYVWLGWTGTGMGSYGSTDNSVSITMNGPINQTAAWRHEYYLAVSSLYGAPTSTSGWFEAGKSITLSVTSPMSGPLGTRYVCTGWAGVGIVSTSGTASSVTFAINATSEIKWNWKTQYLLTVHTDPAGLDPQPNVYPLGPWYDNGTLVTVTAREISGRVFDHWTFDGANWDPGVRSISVTMDGPNEGTAFYMRALAWWENLVRPDVLQVILGLVGIVLTVGLLGGAWFRTQRRKVVIKTWLNEIDDVYSKFKSNPQRCAQELTRLRNTILEGVTDGRITHENYAILDERIDKYMGEILEKQ